MLRPGEPGQTRRGPSRPGARHGACGPAGALGGGGSGRAEEPTEAEAQRAQGQADWLTLGLTLTCMKVWHSVTKLPLVISLNLSLMSATLVASKIKA